MKSILKSATNGKRVLILGYGREGKSTLKLLRASCPETDLTVADLNSEIILQNPELNSTDIKVISGPGYLEHIHHYDLVIKSPGISLHHAGIPFDPSKISSQTDLFLQAYGSQTVGITGTKGKSTTSSLLYHIFKGYTSNCLLAGNIGIPLFDLVPHINPETRIVCELSSHQLEFISRGPHVAILLNLFQEHLDHYASFYHYQLAKMQIGLKQEKNDAFIFHAADMNIAELMHANQPQSRLFPLYNNEFSKNGIGISGNHIILRYADNERILLPSEPETKLPGPHNLLNIMAASAAASLMNIPAQSVAQGVASFSPLEHRIEFVGVFRNKYYYNDSISTIPEATMAAITTLHKVNTLILGGFDRGIDYSALILFLADRKDIRLVFTGPAGMRMKKMLDTLSSENVTYEMADSFDQAVNIASQLTPEGGICLLSPAASSYDSFKNFEERGRRFKDLVSNKSF